MISARYRPPCPEMPDRENQTAVRPAVRVERVVRRFARKNLLVLTLAAIAIVILFFPSLFMGRILTPNDVFYNYFPWEAAADVEPQNPLIHDPPTAYFTLMSLLEREPASFHWNRYIAAGVPGFGSAAAAVLSPFILIPTLLLPLRCVYAGIILLKFLAGLWLAYLWLREERLGKRASAIGATVFTLAGVYSVWWLWQATNATVLFPALLLLVARLTRGRNVSFVAVALVTLALALSGFPAVVIYGIYAALLLFVFGAVRHRRLRLPHLLRAVGGGIVGALLAAPFLDPFVRLLDTTGYLEVRASAAADYVFPLSHLQAFFFPFRYGNPADHLWTGISGLPGGSNFIESTIYIGLLTIPLALAGVFARRAAAARFWMVVLAALLFVMFSRTPLTGWVAELPGIKFSAIARLRTLLPLPFAYLAAAGVAAVWRLCSRFRPSVMMKRGFFYGIGAAIAVDLAFFAAAFYPYNPPEVATPPLTPAVRFLQNAEQPFRFAGFFPWLIPNTSELYRLEDIRAHFSSEAAYRAMLRRIDPTAETTSTILLFNALHFDLKDPLLSMLNTRYLVEQPTIDIVRWSIYEATEEGVPRRGELELEAGRKVWRTIHVPAGPFHAVEIPFRLVRARAPAPTLTARLLRPETGDLLDTRAVKGEELRLLEKVYLRVPRDTLSGEAFVVELASSGADISLPGADAPAGESRFYFGRVTIPTILIHEFPDGRIFENLAVLPRFHAVWNAVALSHEEMLARREIDFSAVAVVEEDAMGALAEIAAVPRALRSVSFRLQRYEPARQEIVVESAAPFLLTSSEKLTPELRVVVNGEQADLLRINTLFAGLVLPAGRHEVVFERKIGRGWWPVSAMALAVLLLVPLANRRFSRAGERRR